MLGISALNNTPLQLRSKVGCFVGILAAFLFIAGAADAQLKFPDGSVQSTAFGGQNNTASGTDGKVGGGVDNVSPGRGWTGAGGSMDTAGGGVRKVWGGVGARTLSTGGSIKACRRRRPAGVRTGMFCKFGSDDERRPVAATA